jgi:hypothetical protein
VLEFSCRSLYEGRALKRKRFRLECFWALWRVQTEVIPTVPREQTDECKALKLSVKAANAPKWAQPSQVSIRELGGTMEDGAGKRVLKYEMREYEMGTEMNRAVAGKGSGWERQSQ